MSYTETVAESRSAYAPEDEPQFEYTLSEIAGRLLTLPSLRVREGANIRKLEGDQTIAKTHPLFFLTTMIDVSLSSYAQKHSHEDATDIVAQRILSEPEELLVIAANSPEYLNKLGLANGQGGRDARAVVWNFLGQRIAAETTAGAQELFRPTHTTMMVKNSDHIPSALGPIGRRERLETMQVAQPLLTIVKRKR